MRLTRVGARTDPDVKHVHGELNERVSMETSVIWLTNDLT